MDAEEKWQKARDILNNNPSTEQQKEAICLLNEAYSSNHAGATYTLAQIYYYGSFLEQDQNRAYTLYKKAIDLGFNKTNFLMAQMCIDGSVVEKNISRAEEILISLAKQDVPEACAMLGWLGLERSESNLTNDEIWQWVNKGASLGNNNCRLYKAKRLQFDGLDNDYFRAIKELSLNGNPLAYYHYAEALYLGIGCEKDAKESVHWFELASKDGDARAMCYLGNRYLDGIGVESQNLEKAIELLTQSANLGFSMAMQNLGVLYAQLCEDEKASFWLDKAIESGMEDSKRLKDEYLSSKFEERLNNAIHIYLNSGNPQKALKLVEDLYSQGEERVLSTMIDIYINGLGDNSFGKNESKAFDILSSKAKDGDIYAKFMIAQFYEGGIAVNQDLDKSFEYYMEAAKADYSHAQYKVGLYYNDVAKDKREAAKWIELAANNEQPDALCMMAYSYLQDPEIETMTIDNLSFDQDIDKGMQLLRHAADLGNADALYILAICYQKGKYVEKDEKKAFELLWTSIQAENTPKSIKKLGDFYRDGIGAAQAYEDAARLYQAASDRGDAGAMIALSELYNEGKGVEKNVELAIQLLKKAGEINEWNIFGKMPLEIAKEQAKQGDIEAMYQLGQRYLNGDGIDKNIEIASDWWLKAAIKGHIKACHDLGTYYVYTKHDTDNGLKWLNKSASENFVLSIRTLGEIYLQGLGIEADTEKGMKYLIKAAEEHDDTQLRLSSLFHEGVFVEKDLDKARYWFEKYLEHDSAHAHYLMGHFLYDGDMYDVDYPKALEHFTKAVKGHCYEASPYYIDMLWRGNHALQDRETVLATYKELDEKGDTEASFYLFTLYNDEEYALRDKDTAITYLRKSAEEGYPVALRYMGFQYMEGGLLETDFNKANEYFIQASERGDYIAMVNLATSYQSGRGVEKDIKKALELFVSAAESGDSYAAGESAKILLAEENGSVESNCDKAIELLQRHADNGDPESCFLIAYIMYAKSDMENSYSWELAEKAFGYMLYAAKSEHPDAMYYVACSFMEGRGVIIDMEQAKYWFEETIKKDHRTEEIRKKLEQYFSGDENAANYPKYIYWHDIAEHNPVLLKEKEPLLDKDGYLIPIAALKGAAQCGEVNAAHLYGIILLKENPEEAKKYITTVIKHGHSDIADEVGKMYYNGDNVERDFEKAIEYFNLGLEAGNIRSALSLGLMYTAEGVPEETEEYGKNLLISVCEATNEDSPEYNFAKTQLDKIEQREKSTMSKLSKGFRSLFGKK